MANIINIEAGLSSTVLENINNNFTNINLDIDDIKLKSDYYNIYNLKINLVNNAGENLEVQNFCIIVDILGESKYYTTNENGEINIPINNSYRYSSKTIILKECLGITINKVVSNSEELSLSKNNEITIVEQENIKIYINKLTTPQIFISSKDFISFPENAQQIKIWGCGAGGQYGFDYTGKAYSGGGSGYVNNIENFILKDNGNFYRFTIGGAGEPPHYKGTTGNTGGSTIIDLIGPTDRENYWTSADTVFTAAGGYGGGRYGSGGNGGSGGAGIDRPTSDPSALTDYGNGGRNGESSATEKGGSGAHITTVCPLNDIEYCKGGNSGSSKYYQNITINNSEGFYGDGGGVLSNGRNEDAKNGVIITKIIW